MSTLSLYNASVPGLIHWMNNLEHVIKTGQANAKERGIDDQVFLTARLAPDMFNLTGQVGVATGLAKNAPFRMADKEPPSFDDLKESYDAIYARLDETRNLLSQFKPDDLDGREGYEFTIQLGPVTRDFTAIQYLSGFILPNVFFHCTTAYNILRHNGVPLGKMDFFGGGGR